MKLLCRQPPCRLAPAPVFQCPRQESNLVFDLRRVACKSPTLRGRFSAQRPAEESNLVLQFRSLPCDPAHPQGHSKCLDQESNLDLDLRRVLCDPLHHRDIQRPDLESNQGQGLRRAPCDPLHHRDGHQSRRLDLHQHDAVYRTAALLVGHVGNQQECEDLNPVGRLWRPLPLPGGHSCIGPRPCDRGPWRNDYSRSVRSSTLR